VSASVHNMVFFITYATSLALASQFFWPRPQHLASASTSLFSVLVNIPGVMLLVVLLISVFFSGM